MTEQQLTDEDIVTRPVGTPLASTVDDADDSGDPTDTGDDTGDPTDTSDTGDDAGDSGDDSSSA
jgi:hypothetical protein